MTPADLQTIRKRKGWTQQGLADALDVTLRAVQFWEAGDRKIAPSMAKLIRMITSYSARGL